MNAALADAILVVHAAFVVFVVAGLPAILKGFFDRVFIPGVSFTLQDGIARPNLTRIRKIAGISTYGRPRWNALWVADPPRSANPTPWAFRRVPSGSAR